MTTASATPPMASSPPPPSVAKPSPAPAKSKKLFSGLFGKGSDAEALDAPKEEPVSAAERKAFEKAVEALKAALSSVRSELSAGRIPPVGPVDQARKALLQALGASALGTSLPALQRLLRTGLLELVAALASGGLSEVPALASRLDRAASDLKDALRPVASEPKFWEKMV